MADVFSASDWNTYKMAYRDPHRELEPADAESAVVEAALTKLVTHKILPDTRYDASKFLAHRAAIREHFEIPWTAITPRMQRLIWAINAIHRPAVMVAAGVFCGNTFISNAGAAVGPGAVYTATELVGIEIKPEEAERAERNVRKLDPTGVARVVAADAIPFCAEYPRPINLLYLDADGDKSTGGKGIYLRILETAWSKMPAGSIILAHNSINAAARLEHYLAHVRNPVHCRASVNCMVDGEGLEVSVR